MHVLTLCRSVQEPVLDEMGEPTGHLTFVSHAVPVQSAGGKISYMIAWDAFARCVALRLGVPYVEFDAKTALITSIIALDTLQPGVDGQDAVNGFFAPLPSSVRFEITALPTEMRAPTHAPASPASDAALPLPVVDAMEQTPAGGDADEPACV